MARSQSSVASASAQLQQAQLDLERTRISVPYAGRIREKQVDVGQYVSPGTELARVFAIDYVEIRLPLSNRQLEYVEVPEIYRGETPNQSSLGPGVTLKARSGRREYRWQGHIDRAEGSFDLSSRQLFVVAQVDNPYKKAADGKPPLKIGQFVEAEIAGRLLRNVIVIPRATIRRGSEVLVVDENNRIQPRGVEIIWSDAEQAVIGGGLEAGEIISLTPLAYAVRGVLIQAQIAEKKSESDNLPGAHDNRARRAPDAASQFRQPGS